VVTALRLGTPAPHVLIRESFSAPANPAPVAPNRSRVGGLQWAKQDNGSDVTQQQASSYCRNSLEGFQDWRLPTIDELQSIYDPAADDGNGHHVAHGIKLTGVPWSPTPGTSSGTAWGFDFFYGFRWPLGVGNSDGIRALCVRRAGE